MTKELVSINPSHQAIKMLDRLVKINGVSFEEQFIAQLISEHMAKNLKESKPTLDTAFEIYIKESASSHRRKFRNDAYRHFNYFKDLFGNLPLEDLRHWHITKYRDYQLARGLNPTSIRKHNNMLNAMINMAFKHLDIDRLSPFRSLHIHGEGDVKRPMATITQDLIRQVKDKLLETDAPYRLVALIQLNTGFRLSEPVYAKVNDLVLDHPIPHLWVRRNELTDRKTKASIRCVPLLGVSQDAAKKLRAIAKDQKSEWLVPHYARENGSTSCSAILNKCLRPYAFRSHMFRHAIIDRIKACNDIPVPLAESITGHGKGGTNFMAYGTVGYTLEQKLEVIKRVLI